MTSRALLPPDDRRAGLAAGFLVFLISVFCCLLSSEAAGRGVVMGVPEGCGDGCEV
jgi:hypothetical protein